MPGLEVERKRLTTAAGLTLPYVEQGSPAGPPIIFIHGYAGSWLDFGLLLPHMPGWIRTIALTQRGHGEASKPAAGYSIDHLAADLKDFLDGLGLKKVVIAGGSSGGFVARRFAIQYPEHILGLIFLGSPATFGDNPAIKTMWDKSISKLEDPVSDEFILDFISDLTDELLEIDFFDELMRQTTAIPARVWKNSFRGLLEFDKIDDLFQIAAPSLILWGDQDKVLPLADQLRMQSAIKDSELIVYPGGGHLFYWEMAQKVATDISEFVRRVNEDSAALKI